MRDLARRFGHWLTHPSPFAASERDLVPVWIRGLVSAFNVLARVVVCAIAIAIAIGLLVRAIGEVFDLGFGFST